MPIPFSQTTRSLQMSGSPGSSLLLGLGMLLLTVWLGWLLAARVSIYVVTPSARLETSRSVHFVEAPVQGQVDTVQAVLGEMVEAGALLISLDAGAERLRLEEARTYLKALETQLTVLRQELVSGGRAQTQARQAGASSIEETRALLDEADAAAQLAENEAGRFRRLYEKRLVSEAEFERVEADARQKRAAAAALQQRIQGIDYNRQKEDSDRRVRLDQLSREIARVEGEQATTEASIERLLHDIERRSVRAPAAGRIGELAELRPGAFVEAGDRLGAVVPDGGLRTVAYFRPSDAAGRIAPGQAARLRLDGFPWTQYGSVESTVERVADELHDGQIRVELFVRPDSAPRIPLQHGLPGTLEVQVEQISPAALVLRHVGKVLHPGQQQAGRVQ